MLVGRVDWNQQQRLSDCYGDAQPPPTKNQTTTKKMTANDWYLQLWKLQRCLDRDWQVSRNSVKI